MTVTPLPPMGQDPSIIEGQRVRSRFAPEAQAIRQNRSLSERQVLEQIVALWQSTNARLSELYDDLQRRRHARLEALAGLVPLGPSVPADASPADAAVIQQAFRVALAQARNAMPSPQHQGSIQPLTPDVNTLDGMLADAERFDDDMLRRAVLTAAHETGNMKLVRRWTDLMGVTNLVEEYSALQDAVSGRGQSGSWNYTVFKPLPAPQEAADLERLNAAESAAAHARVQDATRLENALRFRR